MHYVTTPFVWDCEFLCLSPRFVSWIYSLPSMVRHSTRSFCFRYTLWVHYGRVWYIMVLMLGYTMLDYGVNTVYSHESSECHDYKIYRYIYIYIMYIFYVETVYTSLMWYHRRSLSYRLYTPNAFCYLHYGCCFLKGIRPCTREGKAVDLRARAKSDSSFCYFFIAFLLVLGGIHDLSAGAVSHAGLSMTGQNWVILGLFCVILRSLAGEGWNMPSLPFEARNGRTLTLGIKSAIPKTPIANFFPMALC